MFLRCTCGATYGSGEDFCPACDAPAADAAPVEMVDTPYDDTPVVVDDDGLIADPPRPRTLGVRWVHEAIDTPPPEPAELIGGLMRQGELVVVVAPRKVGKSWTAMNMAILLARGEGQLFGQLPIRRRCRVLLAQGELDQWGSWSRWTHLTAGDGPPEGIGEVFDRWRVRIEKVRTNEHDRDTGLSWSSERYEARLDDRLEATIVEHGIDVLIIDPWAVFFSGSENSNDEVEAALSRLRELSMRTGVAIVIVHHISKVLDVRDPEDMWRGASRLADWASTGLTMLPHYRREADWESAGLTRQKARWYVDLHFMRRSTPTEDFSIRWDPTTGWWEQWEIPAEEQARASISLDALVRACEEAGGQWSSIRAAAEDLGLGNYETTRLLEHAARKGRLEEVKGGRGRAFRLAGPHLQLVPEPPEPAGDEPPHDDHDYWDGEY